MERNSAQINEAINVMIVKEGVRVTKRMEMSMMRMGVRMNWSVRKPVRRSVRMGHIS